MSSPFVWFHHNGQKPKETKRFFESLFNWKASEGPAGMTMLAVEESPFAAVGSKQDRYGERDEWVPFMAVDDVEAVPTLIAESVGVALLQADRLERAGRILVTGISACADQQLSVPLVRQRDLEFRISERAVDVAMGHRCRPMLVDVDVSLRPGARRQREVRDDDHAVVKRDKSGRCRRSISIHQIPP